jgi:uncharacterized protein YukE
MVFGWGKKKSEKQEPEMAPQTQKILLSDVPNIVDEIRSIRTKTIIAEAKTFKNKIKPRCETILHIAIDLERDTLNVDDIDIHLKRLVERGKKEVISIIKRESIVQLPEINSYDDVKIFNATSSKMLKKIGDALGRQSNVIHIFAKKYAKKLKSDLSIMTDGSDEINTVIENYSELEDSIKQILDSISKREASAKSIIELHQQQEKTEKNMQDLKSIIEDNIKNIKHIKDGKQYVEFLENKKKIDSLSSEKSKIKNEIGLQFVKISRPLNKYVYVSAKPQKKLLAGLIDNPYDVLTETNKNDIAQILESVRKGIESGSVSVKDVSKSISQIDETLPKLDNFIKQIITYDKSKNDIEVELSNFDDEQLRLEESNLARSQRDKLAAESKIKLLDSEITKTVESIPRYIKSIESILNQISAVQYKIKQS